MKKEWKEGNRVQYVGNAAEKKLKELQKHGKFIDFEELGDIYRDDEGYWVVVEIRMPPGELETTAFEMGTYEPPIVDYLIVGPFKTLRSARRFARGD